MPVYSTGHGLSSHSNSSFPALPSAFTPLTPTATTPATSTSSMSSSSSAVSRNSSVRSTASVVAVPMKKPTRGPAAKGPPLSRNNSNIGKGFDSSSVAAPLSPTHESFPPGTGGSYFAGAAPPQQHAFGESSESMSRQSSSSAGGGTYTEGRTPGGLWDRPRGTPAISPAESKLSDWTAVGVAVDAASADANGRRRASVDSKEAMTPTRPEHARARESTFEPGRPRTSRDHSAGSIQLVRKTIDDFTFGATLGEGSYSTVCLVTDKHPPNRSYALKILDKDHIKREKKTKYVLIERDTLKALDGHPGIVRLYWTFQDAQSLYYVLELARNGELLKWIKRFGSFHLESARFYAAQILSAVEHMHKKGVIHRDLKPENILLDDQMRVKITDFGTAKLLTETGVKTGEDDSAAPRSRSFVGTPEYVSPEILSERKESSPSSDYWGFGCILYQILAGRPPFQARTEYLMFQKIVNLEYEFPLGFPAEAKDLVEKLLVVNPKDRLGGGPEGIAAIKSHPFFTAEPAIDFDSIWTIDPPAIETGLCEPRREVKGEFVLLDDFGADSDEEGAVAGDEDGGIRGEGDEDQERQYEDGDSALRRSDSIESARADTLASDASDGPRTKWTGVLGPTETIVFASPVLVRRGFITKKRSLILTDFPRLICIKDSPTKVRLKNEVFVGQALRGGVTKPGALAFIKAETEGDKTIVIRTSQRTLKFDEPGGSASRWVAELREVHTRGLQGAVR